MDKQDLRRRLVQAVMGAAMTKDALPDLVAALRGAQGRAALVDLLLDAGATVGRTKLAAALEAAASRLRAR